MPILSLNDLKRESARVSFGKNLLLQPNIFEIYDLENDTVFDHYSDLEFIFALQNHLISRGYIIDEDFYYQFHPNTVQFVLSKGNMMIEYNAIHDLYFKGILLPPVSEIISIYFRDSFILPSTLSTFYEYFITSDENNFYDASGEPLMVRKN